MQGFLQTLLLYLLVCKTHAGFVTKKRGENAFKLQKETTTPSLKQQQDAIVAAALAYCAEEGCNQPPFAAAQAAASMLPAKKHEYNDWDDEMVVGFGTGVLACVVSLAVGFSFGYM
mmetsp:Transcript_41247/g.46876  ORF Transcript_41247/g.46876 Transcript_41247/m.46876 type:complete len:116 (+) Transcript_41247:136-483(+)